MEIALDSLSSDPHIQQLRERLAIHPVFRSAAASIPALCRFAEHHVFAVWDFMSLLKSLQRDLTCTAIPWTPRADADSARFVNEIVLAEESDRLPDGRVTSHFALYLDAMADIGADTTKVRSFVDLIANGVDVGTALSDAGAPQAVRPFVAGTMGIVEHDSVHARAAAFLFGREDLIPDMFMTFLEELHEAGSPCGVMRLYLERHVEVDAEHRILARHLVGRLCGKEASRWTEARDSAARALNARVELWDAVHGCLAPDQGCSGDRGPHP